MACVGRKFGLPWYKVPQGVKRTPHALILACWRKASRRPSQDHPLPHPLVCIRFDCHFTLDNHRPQYYVKQQKAIPGPFDRGILAFWALEPNIIGYYVKLGRGLSPLRVTLW